MASPKAEYYEGMPQIDPAFMPNLAFWLVVTMVVIYFLLNRIALPRIAGILEDRHSTIANDLDQAADLKAKAEAAEDAYQEALRNAKAEAQTIAGAAKAEIQKELDLAIEKADAEIAAKAAESEKRIAEIREGAMAAVADVAKDAAAELIGAVSPAKADKKTITAAVNAALKG